MGRQFGALGGARFAPFEYEFGDCTLSIEADNPVILPDGVSLEWNLRAAERQNLKLSNSKA